MPKMFKRGQTGRPVEAIFYDGLSETKKEVLDFVGEENVETGHFNFDSSVLNVNTSIGMQRLKPEHYIFRQSGELLILSKERFERMGFVEVCDE